MTYINVDSVKQQDGQAYTKYQGTASQTSQTYVYRSKQDNVSITNLGFYDITVVVNGVSTVISQNRSALFTNVLQFSITVAQGKQDFMAESWVVNNLNTDGLNNIFIGVGALSNPGTTPEAVAIGYQALRDNRPDGTQDSGMYNVAVGTRALQLNTIGNHNTGVGWQALQANTTGSKNTAIGEDALLANTTSGSNTAMGAHCLQNSTGTSNTAVGDGCLQQVTTGYYIVAVGQNIGIPNFAVGSNCVSDDRMVFMGAMCGVDHSVNTGAFTNSISIGFQALVNNSNTVQIGNTNITQGFLGSDRIMAGKSGTTANRPTTFLYAGMPYFDTTLGTQGKPIWRNAANTGWVDATGTAA